MILSIASLLPYSKPLVTSPILIISLHSLSKFSALMAAAQSGRRTQSRRRLRPLAGAPRADRRRTAPLVAAAHRAALR